MWRNKCFSIPTWLVIFITTFPHMGIVQAQISTSLESVLRNFTHAALKGLGSFSNVDSFTMPQELDDMTPKPKEIFDFIVVGAGSAGAAIAARLTESKGTKVLLIEAGDKENILMDVPLMAAQLAMSKDITWGYAMEISPNYCRANIGKACALPRGKVMGGSSTINYMVATRGCHQIYDQWAKAGCDGWSYNDVLPLFKKLEGLQSSDPAVDWQYHGRTGPVGCSQTPEANNSLAAMAFLEAGIELGYPVVDYDGATQIGFARVHSTVKDGMRCSSNRAYLQPIKGRPNLFLTKNSLVDKVLIDNAKKRAFGVLFTKNGNQIEVLAKKEVILCAGAINSPQLLMLSGIGPAALLQKNNIPIIKDAPVGENLMDHFAYLALNFEVNSNVTPGSINIFDPNHPAAKQYADKRVGPFALPVNTEITAFIDVDNLKNRNGVPNIQLIFSGSGASSINAGADKAYFIPTFAKLVGKPAYTILVNLVDPKSRGKLVIRSNNPRDKPMVFPNYVNDPDDMKRLIKGIREAIRLSKTKALQRFNSSLSSNPILGCEKFQAGSDEHWDCAIRTFGGSLFHPVGTCKMGALNDTTAVVDPKLKVIGIKGLRVADASIMPVIVTAHTNIPTIMIGEKLAVMVKDEWKLI